MGRMICYPVGNGDTTLLDPESHRLVLIDFCNRPADAADDDKRVDLAPALDAELNRAHQDAFEVVAFTHLDLDHIGGASSYFHFDHNKKYQGGNRRRIGTMWVPAAIITEKEDKDNPFREDHVAVQEEARFRLRKGSGVVVYSCPPDLKAWLTKNGLTEDSRKSCICHAGALAPGFSKDADGVEFFIHAPVSSEEDISHDVERNECSLVMQAVFLAGGTETKVLLLSDATHGLLTDIVERTEKRDNQDRLKWDIVHIPHHCSYLSIGPEKGETETTPVSEVERLYETYGEQRSWLISSSDPIPSADEVQPPHMQAANYYRKTARGLLAMWTVTMEYPSTNRPKPMEITIDRSGMKLVSQVAVGSSAIVSHQAPRAG